MTPEQIELPVSAEYQAEVPKEAYATFLARMNALSTQLAFQFVDANTVDWQGQRALFLDPDHLDADGAEKMAGSLCRDVLVPLLK